MVNPEKTIRAQLEWILTDQRFDASALLMALKRESRLRSLYEARAGVKRPTTLEQHTLMVMSQFELYFAAYTLPCNYSTKSFRLLLALHDIGKPTAVAEGDKSKQYVYSSRIIQSIQPELPIDAPELSLGLALISDDPLGLYMRQRLSIVDAANRIKEMAERGSSGVSEFFSLMTIYYDVDAGSYTRDAFIGSPDDFILKPKVEMMFRYDSSGRKILHPNRLMLALAPSAQEHYEAIARYLGGG